MRSRRVLRVAVVIGTRPEAIKMAPIILEMRRQSGDVEPVVVATAQHRGMLDQVLAQFGIAPEIDLDLMQPDQGLADLTSRLITALHDVWQRTRPDMVLVQGDTTSSFAGGLTAYYAQIPIGHIEAGLRTHLKYSPFPEEMNRRLTDAMADLCFAPTPSAKRNLLEERVPESRIHVTGNTGIDALLWMVDHNRASSFAAPRIPAEAFGRRHLLLVTGHRRESFGEGFANICSALRTIAVARPDVSIVYPVHPNPNVRGPVSERLSGLSNVHLVEPLDYQTFVYAMQRSSLILTDSGGIQEEAPSLNVPVLVMRAATERQEAVDAGVAELVGTDASRIVDRVVDQLDRPKSVDARGNPFGDGQAARRIVQLVSAHLRDGGEPSDAIPIGRVPVRVP